MVQAERIGPRRLQEVDQDRLALLHRDGLPQRPCRRPKAQPVAAPSAKGLGQLPLSPGTPCDFIRWLGVRDMSEEPKDVWDRIDRQSRERTIERVMLAFGAVAALAIVAGLIWLFSAGLPEHWLGYCVAVLVAAGLASVRVGALGLCLLLTALATFLFGALGLLGGLMLTILALLAKR